MHGIRNRNQTGTTMQLVGDQAVNIVFNCSASKSAFT